MKNIPGEVVPFTQHATLAQANVKNGPRCSDADRRKTTDTIIANHHAGRLSTAEADARKLLALEAVTESELADLVRDIPGISKARAVQPYKAAVAGFGGALLALVGGGFTGLEVMAGTPGWTRPGITGTKIAMCATGCVAFIGAIIVIILFVFWADARSKKQKRGDVT